MIRVQSEGTIDIKIDATLDTHDLEVLIKQLITARSGMHPPISSSAPTDQEVEEGGVTIYDDGSFEARCRPDGTCSLLARNAGLGWMYCTLTAATELKLRDMFMSSTSNSPPAYRSVDQITP